MKKEKKFNYERNTNKNKTYTTPAEFRYMLRGLGDDFEEKIHDPVQLANFCYSTMRLYKHSQARIIIKNFLNEYMEKNNRNYEDYDRIFYQEARAYILINDNEIMHQFFVELQKIFNEGAVRNFKKGTGLEE